MPDNTRDIRLSLTLGGGGEQLKPVRIDAHEGLSQPFAVSVEVLAQVEIELLPNLGKVASIECLIDGERVRYFHGRVIDAAFLAEQAGAGFVYRLTLGPTAHYHEQGSNYRIFQNMKVIAIVERVLGQCGIDYKIDAGGGQRMLPYCVQYGESDFAFVCRLLEEEGLYYFYRHTAGSHVMTICDKTSGHPELPVGSLHFNPTSGTVAVVDSRMREWQTVGTYVQKWQEVATSGAEKCVTFRDFDFTKPKTVPTEAVQDRIHEQDEIEVYCWPGRYYQEADGNHLAAVLLESRRAQRLRYEAQCEYAGIQAGFRFKLTGDAHERFLNRKYLIISCRMQLTDEQYRSGTSGGGTLVEFTAIPETVQFRAPIVTPRPLVRGPETAIVTGSPNEEIHVDEYGRIKVHFHWDRYGAQDDTSSCWIRVAQFGALGTFDHPRVGEEVLIEFINGNPDRPIVVGRVYNEAHRPIYALPARKTMAVWRSKTYKKDGFVQYPDAVPIDVDRDCKRGGNEIRIDDATDEPQIFVYAEKDMKTRISYCESHKVGKDVDIFVGKNRTEEVGEDEKITIVGHRNEEVKKTETVKVIGDRSVQIISNEKLAVTGTIQNSSQKTIEITALESITLKVGTSKIVIDQGSITLDTTILQLKGQGMAMLTSPMTTVKGDGMLTARGGLVMIN